MLWIALAINMMMFAGEIAAGIASGSRSLQADALDFLGDSANYAISLGVASMALGWRSRAALLKGGTILAFGLYVLITTLLAAAGVLGTGTAWPDLAVALIMAGLGIWGGVQIIIQARTELYPKPLGGTSAQRSLTSGRLQLLERK